MKNFWVITGVAIVACVIFGAEAYMRGLEASTVVFGMKTVAFGSHEPAWIQFGGTGVIVVGAGFGVVAFTMYGAGVLFATGQVAGALFAFGQLAVGVLCVFGQLAFGICGVGQVAVGWKVIGQLPIGFDGEPFLTRMSNDLDDILRVWKRRT